MNDDRLIALAQELLDEWEKREACLYSALQDVEEGEPGRRIFAKGNFVGAVSTTYPAWMRNRGWTKDAVTRALAKALDCETLGIRQSEMVSSALEYYQKSEERKLTYYGHQTEP